MYDLEWKREKRKERENIRHKSKRKIKKRREKETRRERREKETRRERREKETRRERREKEERMKVENNIMTKEHLFHLHSNLYHAHTGQLSPRNCQRA